MGRIRRWYFIVHGTVVSIVPWNSPAHLAFNQIVSALFAANTVVGKVGFTGSIPSARHIGACVAEHVGSMTMELGGNDAAIFLDDVHIT